MEAIVKLDKIENETENETTKYHHCMIEGNEKSWLEIIEKPESK